MSNMKRIARYFRVLANPTRLSIFTEIIESSCRYCTDEGEISDNCVTHISKKLKVPQPTVSNHVRELMSSELVDTIRRGKHIYLFPAKKFNDDLSQFSQYVSEKVVK